MIGEKERVALLAAETREHTETCMRLATDAERDVLASRARRTLCIIDEEDEDRPGAFHVSRNPPRPHFCRIIPFPIRK